MTYAQMYVCLKKNLLIQNQHSMTILLNLLTKTTKDGQQIGLTGLKI